MQTGTERSTDAVWAVSADGWNYATRVVGASRIRAVDPARPALHRSAPLAAQAPG